MPASKRSPSAPQLKKATGVLKAILIDFEPHKNGTHADLRAAYYFRVPLTRRGQAEVKMVEFEGEVVRAAHKTAFIAVRMVV